MKKATKGALAAAAAGSLMLGGAGSLAYWTATGTVNGAAIASGHLKLNSGVCDGWQLNNGTPMTSAAFSAVKIVPGDVLKNVCILTVDMVGDSLKAKFDVTSPSTQTVSPTALSSALTPTAAYKVAPSSPAPTWSGVAPATPGTSQIHPGDLIQATITVTFPNTGITSGVGNDNGTNTATGLAATLDAITVTATQIP